MGFFSKIADKFGKDETTEIHNLETGEHVKITRMKEPHSIKKPEERTMEKHDVSESHEDVVKGGAARASVKEPAKKIDLVTLLEEDIRKAVSIKEERDELLKEVLSLREQLKDLNSHKSAKEHAEGKLADLETATKKLTDEKAELEESIGRLKEEREAVEAKLRKYETVLMRIKDKVVDMDKNLS